jgi:hypothetical protein
MFGDQVVLKKVMKNVLAIPCLGLEVMGEFFLATRD